MTTQKAGRVVQVLSGVSWARAITALGLGALLLWGPVATASGQVTGQIVQQFFVPFPETDFKTSLQAIAAGNAVSNQIMTTVSIVVGTTNTIIVYDHWEDGYENDLSHPVQSSTLIWGDGNTNTPAPGYPSNILPLGAVITLTNVVTLPRNPSAVKFDGRDRIGATKAVTVTRAGWSTNIGTLMATATEVYDTSRYGTYFIIPVGTNTTPAIQNFSYSSLHIIAAQDNTVVMVDLNGDGIMDVTNTLNMGESMFVNGGVLSGATVTASKPVQVHQMTGRIGSNYQSRTFAIRPVSQWDTSYYAPVGTTSASYVHNVFVFNQYLTNLTVLYSTQTTNGSFTVTNSSPYKFPMPLNSGAHFYTTNGATFYAVGCNDTGSSTPSNNQNYDWGYALLPAAALTPVVIVGWAPGSDFTSGAPANGSPVWVTPTKAATIYVNYSGNYNTGPLIAPNGHHYDTNYTLAAYQFQTIYNATTKNMTGARIFTVDGTTFAAAWGEDPSTAGTGLPYMDAGTGIIPFPQPVMTKSSQLVVDLNGDGKPGWGDTLEYTVRVQNEGMLALGNVLVLDALPNTVTYVTNSTTLNGAPVADNLVPPALTAFPLDESGLELPQIQVGGYSDVKYRVVINAGATSVSNAVMGSTGSDPVTSTESVLVAGPVLLAFTDAAGNPVSSYVTNSGVYISLTDLIQNTNVNTAQSVTVNVTNLSNGDVESVILTETGTNTGIFRNTSPLPMSSTGVTNKFDGTLRSQAGQFLYVAYTDPVSTNSGYANATVTAAPMPYTTKSSLLLVDQYGNGRITWGDTVQYSILLTNTGAQTMSNLVVRDTLPASVSYVTNSTTTNGVALADSGTTPFPLDESGLSVPRLATNSSVLLQFRVTVNSGTVLSNSVTVTNLSGLVQAQDVASVSLPPPSCNLSFTDSSGNPVSAFAENTGIYATMTDSSQNTNPTNAQTLTVTIANLSGGDVESLLLTETGTNTGVFRNTMPLPTSSVLGTAQQDGTLNGKAGQVVSVSFTGLGGETCSASATFVPAVQTKKLYLSGPGQSLDRVDPVATGGTNLLSTATLIGPGFYTLGLDAATTGTMNNQNTLSFSHTTGTGTNRLLLIGCSLDQGNSQSVTSASYGGQALSNALAVTQAGTHPRVEVWYLTNPPAGANTLTVNFSGKVHAVVGAATFTNVNLTAPLAGFATNSGNGLTASVVSASASGELLFNAVTYGDRTGTLTNGPGQSQLWNQVDGGNTITSGGSTKPGAASVTNSWNYPTAKDWAIGTVRITPAAYAGSGTSFTQTPAMCQNFTLAAGGALVVTGYVQVVSGSMPSTPNISALLSAGGSVFATFTNAAYNAAAGTLAWSGVQAGNLTVPAGQAFSLLLTNNQSGVSFNIQYDSSSKPSAISLPTTTVISVDQLGVYDAAYPGNTLVTNAIIGQTVYIRATASDPFGGYDVTGLSLAIRDPGGYLLTTNLPATSVVATSTCSKTYEYPLPTGNWQGQYNVMATAYEGTEGITNASVTTFQAHYPAGGTPSTTAFINASGNPTNSYATNETVCVQVQDQDMNQNPAAAETVSVVITTTSGDRETVLLTETGTNTGVFTGCIAANTSAAVPGNTVLNAPGGAGLTATFTDPLYPSNISSDTAIVRLPPGPKPVVSLFKTLIQPANSTVLLGSPVQFDIQVANPGSVTVTNVQLTDTFPSNRLQFVSATIPPNTTTPAGTLTWNNLGPLAPGTNVIISTYFTAKLAGALTNSVSVSGTTNVGPVTAAATNSISAIAVSKTLVSPNPGPAYINSNVVFRIAITNTGVNPISSYTLQDQFSSSCFQFLGASLAPGGSGGGILLWSGMSGLAVGASTNIYVTNKVTGDCEPAVNNAYLSSVVDQSGKSVPNAQSSTSITNLGASISGTIWYDANANGTNDIGDSPITSAIVYVDLNGDGVRQGSEPFATTDTNGLYQIVSIPAGNYAVRVDTNSLVPGLRPTYDLDGTNTPNEVSMTISNGQVITGLDFGYVGSGSIGGYVWSDINGNGVWQAGAPGLPGVNVFVDLNANGVRDAGEPYAATSPDGSFAFNYLVAGKYRVAVDILSLPPNMRPTFDLDGTNTPNVATITLGAGQNITNANFGYQGRASLAGVLTDTVTGLPILGATVVVVDSLGTTQTVSTGLSGGYNVASVWTGPATVTASQIGFGSAGANPMIVAGANVQNLSLTANTLVGVITNTATGLPIAGATVQVVDSASITNTLATDASGHYGITNIAAGVATITASQSGYVAASTSPTIAAGANVQDLGLTPNSLTGLVTDAVTMLPITGASVSVTDSSNVVHTVTTDATGHYSVTVLPTGPATVTASQLGFGSAGANPIILAGANVQNLSLTANTLVGLITNTATGLPIAGATVQVVDSASITNTLATDASGHYGITNIASGVATITASQSGYVAASTSPTIVAGANTQNLGLTPNSLTGLVTDAVTMLPITGASVSVTDSSNAVHTVTTDATGHYSVTVLPTGPATVTASQLGFGSAGANPIILAGANVQNLSLTANTLVGLITNTATGLPIAGATVQVVDSASITNTLATDASGHYGITNIAAGVATITASQSGYVAASTSPTIAAGANVQDLGLTPNSLTGLVTDAVTMLPIAGASVSVTDSSNVVHTVTTDATGSYGVTVLPTGPATVSASQTGYGSAGANPVILAGANAQNLSLSANTLTGIITDSLSGLPIAGATVVVIDGAGVNTSIVTGPSGAYSVSGIAVGAASVTANMVGYSSANASPVISAGANTQDLKLIPNILAGHVTDEASHQPLAGVLVQVIDGSGTTNTITTDATGYYGVTNIAPGAATVTASKSGYTTASATPTIVAGPNTQDLQLSVSNPTLALLSSIKAYFADDGVAVRWQTASEAGSVSFDLYRKAPVGDKWVKVNAVPVLAANSPTGSTYEVADPDAKPAGVLAYRLVELEEQGTTRTYGPFGLRAEAPTPAAPTKALVTETASPLAKAAFVRSPQPLAQAASAPLSTLDRSRFIKIITTNSGIQNVTATALGTVLGQAPANIQSAIAARSLRLSNQGQPVAYVPNADGSALSFYAEPLKNNYTAQNVYSLTFAPGLPLGTVLSPPTTPVPAATLAYLAELDLEQDLLAVPSLMQDPSQDFWMWQRLVAGIPMFNTAAFSFALDHLSLGGSGTASLTLHLMGGDQAIHTVQASLNGSLVGQDTWQGCTAHDTVLQIPSSRLIEGSNQLSLQAVATAGSATSQWYVNGFGLRYPRQYFATNGTLLFNANSNSVITVDGFTSPAITVLEITDPKQPVLVQNLTIAPTEAGYSASFAPSDPQNQFVAFQSGAGTTPASVAFAQTANLSRGANAADYIIIAPDSLTSSAGQLAAYRQRKGLRPIVVSLDQIYDEFSSGIITPEAIRQFLRTALTNWAVKPRYVVLIGNGTYDYRDLLQQHDNLMPPLLVNTTYGLFCSDSAYGDLNGDGQPEIAVGRLPVKTAQQLLALIGKIQSYEALPQTAPAQALLVADAPDSAGDFTAAIQQVSSTLVGSYSNTVVQGAGQSNLGPVRQAIQSSFNAGVDLVDYIGHGAIDRFGNYGYLTSADVAALQNGARLPVVVAVTCVAGQYSVPGSDCLAGYLSMQNAGGAIAVVAPTGLSVDQDASRLNLRLLNLLRANAGPGVGDMFRQALADHVALDNPTTQPAIYNLIGDPALAYNVAVQTSAAAPQFTGTSVTNGMLVITWSGGQPPYQLEQTTILGPKASWQPVGSPVSGFTTTLPVTGPMGFIRVRCPR